MGGADRTSLRAGVNDAAWARRTPEACLPERRAGLADPLSRTALLVGWLVSVLALAGCAAPVPVMIRTAPAVALDPAEVQQAPAASIGRAVRWGGRILAVQNRADQTEILILARPLAAQGAPRPGAAPLGRFIAKVPGFIDPSDLPVDRDLTVSGTVTGVEVRPVGEYPYPYPVVAVTDRWLWPEPVTRADPWCCGPGWGPWGPWWPGYGPWGAPWYW